MTKEIKGLQVAELGDVKVLVDEKKVEEKPADSTNRFAQLLEYFWKKDEEGEEAAALAESEI